MNKFIVCIPRTTRHSLRHILKYPHNPQHRSRINPLTLRLVIKRNIPTRNRRPQRITSLGNPIDRLRKLRHNLRLLRIPEVQTIRSRHRSRPGTSHLPRSLSHSMHRPQLRIKISPSPIPSQRHRQVHGHLLPVDLRGLTRRIRRNHRIRRVHIPRSQRSPALRRRRRHQHLQPFPSHYAQMPADRRCASHSVPVPLIRITPASPPGPCTVLVCTIESYCSNTHRLSQIFALASSFFRSAV